MDNQHFELESFIKAIGYWLALPVLVTFLGFLPDQVLNHSALLMLYLMSVLICSLKAHLSVVVACSILSFFLFSFFHTQPHYTLYMRDSAELISSLLFIIFSMLAGGISHELKKQLKHQERQGRFLKAQVSLGKQLQSVTQEDEVLPLLNKIVRDVLGKHLDFRLLPPNTSNNPTNSWYLTWTVNERDKPYGDEYTMVTNIKEQAQVVLERLAMNRELQAVERQSDEERLRSALLSSVSHDLKPPLMGMMQAANELSQGTAEKEQQHELTERIIEEARRLESYIQNLLDMTRIGHGQLSLSRERIEVDELYAQVRERLGHQWPDANIQVKRPDELPALYVHTALIEHALFNALDNALKAEHCVKRNEVLLSIKKRKGILEFYVCDHGPGLPRDEWESAFTQYYSCSNHGDYQKGTGLGLSICRSIFRVHNGEAEIIEPPPGFGHCLRLTLPLHQPEDNEAD